MKKKVILIIFLTAAIAIAGMIAFETYTSSGVYRKKHAAQTLSVGNSKIEEGTLKIYSENADGTWECEGNTYQYKLEITGKMENAAADSTFVYLSNFKEISFEQAWKAAGLSSNTDDYFDEKDAVLVEMRME